MKIILPLAESMVEEGCWCVVDWFVEGDNIVNILNIEYRQS